MSKEKFLNRLKTLGVSKNIIKLIQKVFIIYG